MINQGLPPVAACWKALCLLPEADDWQFVVRVSFGLLNLACSVVFTALLRRQNAMRAVWSNGVNSKNSVGSQSTVKSIKKFSLQSNSFVASAILFELLFNSIPHAACLVYEMVRTSSTSGKLKSACRFRPPPRTSHKFSGLSATLLILLTASSAP